MDPAIITSLVSLGGPYLVIAVLLGVTAKLWDLLQKSQQALLDDKDKQLDAAQATFTTVTAALATVETTIAVLQEQAKGRSR